MKIFLSRKLSPLLVWVSLLASQSSHAVEIVRWERLPLAVPLVIGQERIVFIDKNVRVGLPKTLGADALRVQSTGGAIYLRANQSIEPTRLQLQDVTTGEIILLDIAAKPAVEGQATLEPIKIIQGEGGPKQYGNTSQSESISSSDDEAEEVAEEAKPKYETPIPVALTRYAAQNLYAPLRTVEPVDGISQANVNKRLDLSSLMPTQPVQATVLGAWSMADHYVTAVKLRNMSSQVIYQLDPRELQGNFVTATFQHQSLGNRGDPSDTTVVYLVTQGRSLADSLLPNVSQIDASKNTGDR